MNRPYTVKGLCQELKEVVEARYPVVWVEGEVTSAKIAGRGHCYLTLGDREARLNAVVWSSVLAQQTVRLEAGIKVLVKGRLSVYPPYGQVQLVVHQVLPAGEGALAKEIAQRRARLDRDGLLDPRRKRALPTFPTCVGVVTSRSAAALQDVLRVTGHRFPAARVVVAHSLVQGPEAPAGLIRALDLLQEDGRCEVIILTRGGGARGDLLAFQDEMLARAVAACAVPVISAIGHETDRSLCDEVADCVAATPSAAAMLAVPDGFDLARRADEADMMLQDAMRRRLRRERLALAGMRSRLRHPGERLALHRERWIRLRTRLLAAMSTVMTRSRNQLTLGAAPLSTALDRPLAVRRGRHEQFVVALHGAMGAALARRQASLHAAHATLDALSPTAVFGRGYAMVRGIDGELIRSVADARQGDQLDVHVSDGVLPVIVSSRGPGEVP